MQAAMLVLSDSQISAFCFLISSLNYAASGAVAQFRPSNILSPVRDHQHQENKTVLPLCRSPAGRRANFQFSMHKSQ